MMEASSSALTYGPSAGFPVGLGLLGDERLAKLVASGNERAFAVLFERYHQPLYRYCRSILRDESDAQDALQSAFAGALVALRRGQRDAPLRPWLYRIAHNESISLLRRRRTAGQELPEAAEPVAASAEEQAQERERLALLVADLHELPDRQRGALVMRELSGLSHDEIAAALGTTPGTAKQAIFEARAALLEFAEGRAMGCEEICRTISDGDRRALRARKVRAHLRQCGPCAAFAEAIPARRADLHALSVPLAPLAGAGILSRLTGGGSAGGGAGGGTASTVVGKLAGVGLTSKALVTAAVVSGAAVGVTGTLKHVAQADRQPESAALTAQPGTVAAGSAGAASHVRRTALASGAASRVVLRHRAGRRATAVSGTTQHHGQARGAAHSQAAAAHATTHGRSGAASHSSASSPVRSHGAGNSAHGGAAASLHSSASAHGSKGGGSQSSAAHPAPPATGQSAGGPANASGASSAAGSQSSTTATAPAQAAQPAGKAVKASQSPGS